MDLNLKLDEIVKLTDLLRTLTWGSLPIWLGLAIPIIYVVYKKTITPSEPANTFLSKIASFFRLPEVDSLIIYSCLILIIVGSFTIMIEKDCKESTRKAGIKMKQYYVTNNLQNVSKNELIIKNDLTISKLDKVLKQYPNEFIAIEDTVIVLRDSISLVKIIYTAEKLLDAYLTDPIFGDSVVYAIDTLFTIPPKLFTRNIAYKLIADSSHKYHFCLLKGDIAGIKRKKR